MRIVPNWHPNRQALGACLRCAPDRYGTNLFAPTDCSTPEYLTPLVPVVLAVARFEHDRHRIACRGSCNAVGPSGLLVRAADHAAWVAKPHTIPHNLRARLHRAPTTSHWRVRRSGWPGDARMPKREVPNGRFGEGDPSPGADAEEGLCGPFGSPSAGRAVRTAKTPPVCDSDSEASVMFRSRPYAIGGSLARV